MNLFVFMMYLLCLSISAVCVVFVCLQESSKEQKIALITTSLVAIICLGYWFEIQSDSVSMMIMAKKIEYIGKSHFYYMMLLYFLLYCKRRMNRKIKYILVGINVIIMTLLINCDNYKSIFKSYHFEMNKGIPQLEVDYGYAYWIMFGVIAAYCIAMIVIAFWHICKSKKKDKINMMVLLSSICVACIGFLMGNVFNHPFSLVPVCLVISECILMFLFYKSKVHDVNVIAREYVFDSLDDGIIILDSKQCYKDANRVALDLFPELSKLKYAKILRHVSKYFENLLNGIENDKFFKNGRWYQPAVRKIFKKRQLTGYVIWFDDITEQQKNLEMSEDYQKNLEQEVSQKTIQVLQMQENMIFGFADIVENRDLITGGHIKRTSAYVEAVVDELKRKGLYSEQIKNGFLDQIRLAAPLHDIGKVAISDTILNKPGRLTDDEFNIMKQHTVIGGKVIDETIMFVEDREYYLIARDVAMYHHEKWNGKGYPEGLSGDEIPLSARIMAIADVFDALVSKRPYKDAYSLDTAFDIIQQESGKQFDPEIVNIFLEIRPEIEHIYNEFMAA